MQIRNNVALSQMTTFRMGGGVITDCFFPENIEELSQILNGMSKEPYFIGGESNIIANDGRIFDEVVCLKNLNKTFVEYGSGLFRIGASLRLQEVIKKTNELGYGGMEYLYSVPGLLGGAIVMNAGRGREYNESISDYIVSVLVFKDGEIHEIKKDDCNFGYRNSIFKTGGCVVIEALMQFEKGDSKLFEKAREERINLVKNAQDTSKPNCGSIFSVSNPSIMRAIMNYIPGKGRVRFSQKTPNWLLNDGGTFSDVEKCLKKAHFFHRLFRKPIQEEVILWR